MTTAIGLEKEEVQLFEEINKVMKKYSHLDRKFGLALVHNHFEISEDEILHETHDPQNRVLTVNTVKLSEVGDAKPTQWVFDKSGQIKVNQYCCDPPEKNE